MMNFWKRLFASLRPQPMATAVLETPPPKPRNEATGNTDLSGSTNYDFTKATNTNVSFAEPAIIRTPEKPAEDFRSSEKPRGNAPKEPSPPSDAGRLLDEFLAQHADRNVVATVTPANTAESASVTSEFERWAAVQDAREKAQQSASENDDDQKDDESDDPKDDSSDGTLGLEMSMVPGRGDLGRCVIRRALRDKEIISIQARSLEEKIKKMEDEGLEPAAIEERTKENVKGIRRAPSPYSKAAIWAAYEPATEEAKKKREEGETTEKDKGPSMGM